ncbi:LCP family protein [bacterium]|jgi:polyisoprenyl-teichoic acid--peptidoglycan teichoic acid transferase|nr:LCP family protein [bacterium]
MQKLLFKHQIIKLSISLSKVIGIFTIVLFSMFIFSSILLSSRFVNALYTLLPGEPIRGTNILVFGIDATKSVKRADSIVVVHVNPITSYIGALSIPRDSYVDIPNRRATKINHAYAYGGSKLLTETVENFLGIKIPYTIKLDVNGVEEIVDSVGGLSITVKKHLLYKDVAGGLDINLAKGSHILNGEQALQYLRFRKDSKGDIGRITRQQNFLKNLVSKLFSSTSLFDLPKLYTLLTSFVSMNIPKTEFLKVSLVAQQAFRNNNFSYATLPGKIFIKNRVSYWGIDPLKKDVFLNDTLLGNDFQLDSEKTYSNEIEIINYSGEITDKKLIITALPNYRFKEKHIPSTFPFEETTLIIWSKSTKDYQTISESLSIDPSQIIVYDNPHKKMSASLILGNDWASKKRSIKKTK